MSPTIGVVTPPWFSPEQLLATAPLVESLGIDELWLWEDCFTESGIGTAAAVLARTERLRVGIGLIPVPLRNVAITAMEIATLDRMFPGRFLPVLGHGVQEWMAQTGTKVESPLTLLREQSVVLGRLLAGEEVTYDGRYVHLDRVRLAHPPTAPVPVRGAGDGERTLALIGEVADGLLLDARTSPARVREVLDLVGSARTAVGRTSPLHVTVYVQLLRGPSATALYEAAVGEPVPEDRDRARALLGTADEVADGVRRLAAAGADSVVLVPHDSDGDLQGFVTHVGRDIRPLVV